MPISPGINIGILRQWYNAPLRHRLLLMSLVRQNIRGRFAGSIGGLFWSVLTPLGYILIYFFVFSVILKIRLPETQVGTDSYIVYLLTGLLPWMAFGETLAAAPGILLSNAQIITKVAFPVEILPFSTVSVIFVLNGAGLTLFIIYLALAGYLHISWLALPLVILLFIMFAMGIAALLSAITVFLRDIKEMVNVILPLWLYLTPILYPLAMVPDKFQGLMMLNPLFPFIDLFRQVLLEHRISPGTLGLAFGLALVSYCAGGWFFMRIKHAFADVL